MFKPFYIVAGESSDPTWDDDNTEHERFDTLNIALANARDRAADHPGEDFFVFSPVAVACAPVGDVEVKRVSLSGKVTR